MDSSPITFKLADSTQAIPAVGFGCWKVAKDLAPSVVEAAIKNGYRHIDCAADYGNEAEVGQGIARAIESGNVKREDLWVTSKLWNTFHEPQHVRPACLKTLKDLGLDYLDLYLIHFPISLKYVPFEKRYPPEWFHDPNVEDPKMELISVPIQSTWEAMEALVKEGLVKNIGVSNFSCQGIRDLMSYANIKPAVLQVELHPYLQQVNLVRYAQSVGIHVTAFSPLGHGASYWNPSVAVINENSVKTIAKKHGVTEAQIVLRFGYQRGYSVIPKTSKTERLKENISLFNFHLTNEDMEELGSLERNLRFNDPGQFCENAFNTFCPIFD